VFHKPADIDDSFDRKIADGRQVFPNSFARVQRTVLDEEVPDRITFAETGVNGYDKRFRITAADDFYSLFEIKCMERIFQRADDLEREQAAFGQLRTDQRTECIPRGTVCADAEEQYFFSCQGDMLQKQRAQFPDSACFLVVNTGVQFYSV